MSKLGQIRKYNKVSLVKFESPDCKSCKQMTDALEEAKLGVKIFTVNVMESPNAANYYGITSLPTVLVLSPDGKEIDRAVGFSGGSIPRLKRVLYESK